MNIHVKYYRYLAFFLFFVATVSCEDDENVPLATSGFSPDKTTVKVREAITFTNTSENATAFKWSFGDGTTATEKSPVKSYAISGTYTVTLAATGRSGTELYHTEVTVLAPELYFTDTDTALIQRFIVDHPDNVSAVKDVTGMAGAGLAFDSEHQKIYFSDFEVTGEGKIWRMNMDGSNLEMIVDGLYDAYQISLDVTNGKLYWAEDAEKDGTGYIGRTNLDGTNQEYVVSIDGGGFYAVAIDTKANKIYYNDWKNRVLYRADSDGSNATPILSDVSGYAIEVDAEHNKIYFENDKLLYRANLDGTDVEPLSDISSRVYGIVVDNDNDLLYWSGYNTGELYRANLDGTGSVVIKTGLGSPRGIFLKK
jgi:PKD repeat protein